MVCNGIVAHSVEELQAKAAAAKAAADKQQVKAQDEKQAEKATTKGGKK